MRTNSSVLVVWIVRTLGAAFRTLGTKIRTLGTRGACNVLVLKVFFGLTTAKTIKTL